MFSDLVHFPKIELVKNQNPDFLLEIFLTLIAFCLGSKKFELGKVI